MHDPFISVMDAQIRDLQNATDASETMLEDVRRRLPSDEDRKKTDRLLSDLDQLRKGYDDISCVSYTVLVPDSWRRLFQICASGYGLLAKSDGAGR